MTSSASDVLQFDWRCTSVVSCSSYSFLTSAAAKAERKGSASKGEALVQLKVDVDDKRGRPPFRDPLIAAPIPVEVDGGRQFAAPSRSIVFELDADALDETIRVLHEAIAKATQ